MKVFAYFTFLFIYCSTASAWSLIPQTRDIGYSCEIFPSTSQNRLPNKPFTIHIHDGQHVLIFTDDYNFYGYTQNKSGRNFTSSLSQPRIASNGEEYDTSNIINVLGSNITWWSSIIGYGDAQEAVGKCKKLKIEDRFADHNIVPKTHKDTFVTQPCTRNSGQCDLGDLCKLAVKQVDGVTSWNTSNDYYRFAIAAKSRNALCGTSPPKPPKNKPAQQPESNPKYSVEPSSSKRTIKTCGNSPIQCTVSNLCRRATTGGNSNKAWSNAKRDRHHVIYAQSQGLACGTEQPPKRTNAIPQSIIGSGTGFAVSGNGDVVTNHHVVKGCDTIKTTVNNRLISLSLVNVDTQNDIALLNSQSIHLPALPFENSAIYPLQDVIAAGYPLIQQLGTSLKFTKGVISSLSGMGKRHSEFQLDAAIQPGNSGGPVVDTETGNVLGMAVAKLAVSQKQIEKGFIPEGTNFAIKASVIRSFLEANNVQFKTGDTLSRKRQELARDLTRSVLLLSCWK